MQRSLGLWIGEEIHHREDLSLPDKLVEIPLAQIISQFDTEAMGDQLDSLLGEGSLTTEVWVVDLLHVVPLDTFNASAVTDDLTRQLIDCE